MRFMKVVVAMVVLAPFGKIYSIATASPIKVDDKHPRSDSSLPGDVKNDHLSSMLHELAMIMPSHSPTGSLRGPPHAVTATDAAGSAKSLLTTTSAERQELLLEEAKELTKRIGRIEPFLSADSVFMAALPEFQRPLFASLQTQLVLAQETSDQMISLFEGVALAKSKSSSSEAARVEAFRRYLSETDEWLIGDEQESPGPEFRSSSNRHKKDHSSSWSHHSFFGGAGAGTHDAFSGDWSFAANYFQTHLGRKITNRAPIHPHGRDLQAGALGQGKKAQCQLLIECAEAMSVYDLVVFFYQDDIDFTDGTFDEPKDIIKYDEGTIMNKQMRINYALGQASDFNPSAAPGDYKDDDACDLLLEEFHITVESDFGPLSYEGNVTNVCLAQGTTQFVKISEIKTAVDESTANRIAEEVFFCARELYENRPMGDDSPFASNKFVYTSDSGTIRLPSGIKKEGTQRDRHGQLNSTDPNDFFDFVACKSLSRGAVVLVAV
jgi:hypothetical protein